MKKLLKRIVKNIAIQFISFLFLIGMIALAANIKWPTQTPGGETLGGKFQTYFNNLKGNCPSGQAVIGINNDFTKKCGVIYTYAWDIGEWGSCSKTCGGGTQSRPVICKRSDNETVTDSYCIGTKPTTSKTCNTQSCCTYDQTLSDGYYVISNTNNTCYPQGCNTPGLPNADTKCIYKNGTTYIAPKSTVVLKQNTPCGGSSSPCSSSILNDSSNVMGYCANATWGGKTNWAFPTYPSTFNTLGGVMQVYGTYWTRHCENCSSYTSIQWRIDHDTGSKKSRANSYYVRCISY